MILSADQISDFVAGKGVRVPDDSSVAQVVNELQVITGVESIGTLSTEKDSFGNAATMVFRLDIDGPVDAGILND